MKHWGTLLLNIWYTGISRIFSLKNPVGRTITVMFSRMFLNKYLSISKNVKKRWEKDRKWAIQTVVTVGESIKPIRVSFPSEVLKSGYILGIYTRIERGTGWGKQGEGTMKFEPYFRTRNRFLRFQNRKMRKFSYLCAISEYSIDSTHILSRKVKGYKIETSHFLIYNF